MTLASRKHIGKDKAIELYETHWWELSTPREIAEFGMAVAELCCPFDVFHKAIEDTLGRSVWTHEFAVNYDGICQELRGEREPPTMEEIIEMIPADKRVILVKEPGE